MEQLLFAGKAYLKINSLVKTPLHEFNLWQLNAPGYGLLSMFIYIRARFRFAQIGGNLTAQWTGSHRGIGGGFLILETWLQALLLFFALPPECQGEFSRRLEKQEGL